MVWPPRSDDNESITPSPSWRVGDLEVALLPHGDPASPGESLLLQAVKKLHAPDEIGSCDSCHAPQVGLFYGYSNMRGEWEAVVSFCRSCGGSFTDPRLLDLDIEELGLSVHAVLSGESEITSQ